MLERFAEGEEAVPPTGSPNASTLGINDKFLKKPFGVRSTSGWKFRTCRKHSTRKTLRASKKPLLEQVRPLLSN
eukprot:166214-Pelagomonas_calceolata.AAC.2